MELKINKAQVDDAEQIIEFLNKVGVESNNLLSSKTNMTVEQEKKYIETVNSAKNRIHILGKIDNKIVGMCGLHGLASERIAHRASLGISVDKEYWNKGIATKMMKYVIDFAKDNGLEIIELQVKTDNIYAIELYKKYGFIPIGAYSKFFKIDGEYFDAVLMNLYL